MGVMYLNSTAYETIVATICQNIEQKIHQIKMHICNPAWMSVTISRKHKMKLQLPTFIRSQRKLENKKVVSANTVEFSELAMMIHQLRDVYLKEHIANNIAPYDRQFENMVISFQKGIDKKQIIKTAIEYIERLSNDLRRRGVAIQIASKEDLWNRYIENQNREFSELAQLMDSIRSSYETQGYIVQLLPYQEQIQFMQDQLKKGKSKSDILLQALNQIEEAKKILSRNGISTDAFPNQETLEKYYIGMDKDYIELAHILDSIRNIYIQYKIPTSLLSYQEQLNWIREEEKKGNNKEQILHQLISIIEQCQLNLAQRNIPYISISSEELFERYSLSRDTTFVSLAQLIDKIRTFYLTHRLNTQLLPYENILKIMKEAYQDGTSEEHIIRTILNTVEEAREDLNSKGYPIILPTKEELYRQYHIEEFKKQL